MTTITRMTLITLFLAVFSCSNYCSSPAAAAGASVMQPVMINSPFLEKPQVPNMTLDAAQGALTSVENHMQSYIPYEYPIYWTEQQRETHEFAKRVHKTYLMPKIQINAAYCNELSRRGNNFSAMDNDPLTKASILNNRKGLNLKDECQGDPDKANKMIDLFQLHIDHARAQAAVLAAQNRDKDTTIQAQAAEIQLLRGQLQQKSAGVPLAPGGAKQ